MILLLSCDDFTDEIIPRFFVVIKRTLLKLIFPPTTFKKYGVSKCFCLIGNKACSFDSLRGAQAEMAKAEKSCVYAKPRGVLICQSLVVERYIVSTPWGLASRVRGQSINRRVRSA